MLDGIDKLYSSFILRDLNFLMVGGCPLAYLLRKYKDSLFHDFSYTISHYPAIFIASFLAISYITGIALFHVFIHRIPIPLIFRKWNSPFRSPFRCPFLQWPLKWGGFSVLIMHPEKWCANQSDYDENEVDSIVLSMKVEGEAPLRRLERIVGLKMLHACVFVVTVTMIALVWIVPLDIPKFAKDDADWRCKMIVPTIVGGVLALFAWWTNRSRARIQSNLLRKIAQQSRPQFE